MRPLAEVMPLSALLDQVEEDLCRELRGDDT